MVDRCARRTHPAVSQIWRASPADVLIARLIEFTAELLNADRSTVFVHVQDQRAGIVYPPYRNPRNPHSRKRGSPRGVSAPASREIAPYADPRFDRGLRQGTWFQDDLDPVRADCQQGGRARVAQVLNSAAGASRQDEARLRAFSAQIAISLDNAGCSRRRR